EGCDWQPQRQRPERRGEGPGRLRIERPSCLPGTADRCAQRSERGGAGSGVRSTEEARGRLTALCRRTILSFAASRRRARLRARGSRNLLAVVPSTLAWHIPPATALILFPGDGPRRARSDEGNRRCLGGRRRPGPLLGGSARDEEEITQHGD